MSIGSHLSRRYLGIFLIAATLATGTGLPAYALVPVDVTGPATLDPSTAIQITDQMCISHAPAEWEYHANNTKMLGTRILRNNIEWFTCAYKYGKSTGIYDFQHYDDLFGNLTSRGIESLGCFVYGWGWWPNNKALPREDWPYYYDFTNAFVSRYAGTLKYYEIFNEPNIGFWTGSDDDFFEFSQKLASIVRINDPSAIILSPGIVGPDVEYLDKMVAYYGLQNFSDTYDIIAYHAYSGKNAEILVQKMAEVKKWMADHHMSDKPVWITEIGMSTAVATNEQIGTALVAENNRYQATQVLKVYAESIPANISSVFWYCQNDWCDVNDTEGEGRFGLMECTNTTYTYGPKPSGYAYWRLNQLIQDGTCFPNGVSIKVPAGGKVWATYFFTAHNTTVLVLWSQNTATAATISLIPPAASAGSPVPFVVTNYDYFANGSRVSAGVERHPLEVGFTPVLLELNYTNPADPGKPLAVLLEMTHVPGMVVLLVGVPAALVAGLLFLFKRVGLLDAISKKRARGGAP
nr:glycosyl hydrolase [Candidatus Sigynarchaeum springense]